MTRLVLGLALMSASVVAIDCLVSWPVCVGLTAAGLLLIIRPVRKALR